MNIGKVTQTENGAKMIGSNVAFRICIKQKFEFQVILNILGRLFKLKFGQTKISIHFAFGFYVKGNDFQ